MRYKAPQQAHTMLFLLTSYVLVLCVALISTYLGSMPSVQRPGMERRQFGHTHQRPGESSSSS